MAPEDIKALLLEKLPEMEFVVDGDGYKYTVIAIGEQFAGLTPVKKQQLVYGAINEKILDGSLHAVSIETYTPEEWQAK